MSAGVKKGDRVSIYMPMVVELVVAMLACVRIGAVHSIVVSLAWRLFTTRGHVTSGGSLCVWLDVRVSLKKDSWD